MYMLRDMGICACTCLEIWGHVHVHAQRYGDMMCDIEGFRASYDGQLAPGRRASMTAACAPAQVTCYMLCVTCYVLRAKSCMFKCYVFMLRAKSCMFKCYVFMLRAKCDMFKCYVFMLRAKCDMFKW